MEHEKSAEENKKIRAANTNNRKAICDYDCLRVAHNSITFSMGV